MNRIGDKDFMGRSSQDYFENVTIEDGKFHNCHFPASFKSKNFTSLKNINLRNCSQLNSSVNTTQIENVTVHNLKRSGDAPLFLIGCVFKHVKLSGRISGIKINRFVEIGVEERRRTQPHWDNRTMKFYQDVDWALDISEAKFPGGISFSAIPGDKIKRNPEIHALIRREKLESSDWKNLDYDNTAKDIELSGFLSGSIFDSVVIATRSASKYKKKDLAIIQMLRDEGIAEQR